MSDEVLIEELRTAMRAEVEDIEVPRGVLAQVLESPRRQHLGLGWLMPALAVGVAAVVAVVAVTSLTHRSSSPQSAFAHVPPAAHRLASHLAVLRRPQRPQDLLPHWAVRETESLTQSPRVLGGLSRLVGAVNLGRYGRARVYLVVQAPPRFPLHLNHPEPPFLNPHLGDQATIAFVGRFREQAAINRPAVAAGSETVAGTRHGLTADPGQFSNLWGAVGAIVPDGVARVKWVFATETRVPRYITVWARVKDNVALGRIPPRLQTYMRTAIWYSAGGRVISTFGIPSPAANARGFRRALEASVRQRVDPALLRHFEVLGGPHASRGLTYSEVASLIEPNPLGLNTRRERFVTSGPAKVFVVPGTQGIALYYVSPIVGQAEEGTSGALDGSMNVVGPRISGKRTIIGLAPDGNRVVTALLPGGRRRRVRVADNVYAMTVPAGIQTLILKNAAGRPVRLRVR